MSDVCDCKRHRLVRVIPKHDRCAVVTGDHDCEALWLLEQSIRACTLLLLCLPQPLDHLAHHSVDHLQETDLEFECRSVQSCGCLCGGLETNRHAWCKAYIGAVWAECLALFSQAFTLPKMMRECSQEMPSQSPDVRMQSCHRKQASMLCRCLRHSDYTLDDMALFTFIVSRMSCPVSSTALTCTNPKSYTFRCPLAPSAPPLVLALPVSSLR